MPHIEIDAKSWGGVFIYPLTSAIEIEADPLAATFAVGFVFRQLPDLRWLKESVHFLIEKGASFWLIRA